MGYLPYQLVSRSSAINSMLWYSHLFVLHVYLPAFVGCCICCFVSLYRDYCLRMLPPAEVTVKTQTLNCNCWGRGKHGQIVHSAAATMPCYTPKTHIHVRKQQVKHQYGSGYTTYRRRMKRHQYMQSSMYSAR